MGGAEITGNGGETRYHSLQIEFRKRLSRGLQFGGSYTFGKGYLENFYSHRRPFEYTEDTGAEGNVTHAFKANWVWDLPFGRGRHWATNVSGFVDRLVGGWSFDGIARVQSGRLVDFGNVRLVGMTNEEFSDEFKLRFDDAGRVVYNLPQDIIDNSVKAHAVSATTLSGYGDLGPPTGRYLAPANGPDCIEIAQSNVTNRSNRVRRMRRARARRHGSAAGAVRPERREARPDRRPRRRRVPRRDVECVQPAVVRAGRATPTATTDTTSTALRYRAVGRDHEPRRPVRDSRELVDLVFSLRSRVRRSPKGDWRLPTGRLRLPPRSAGLRSPALSLPF